MYNQVNKIAYITAIVLLLSVSLFVGCESKKEENAEKSKETVFVAEKSSTEWDKYKASAEKSIANNDDRIQTLKEKIQNSGMPNLDKLRQKQINDLEDRNTALRTKIMGYKADEAQSNWQQFKLDIQKELEELEKSIANLSK